MALLREGPKELAPTYVRARLQVQLRAGAARGVMLHVHQLDAMTLLYVLRLLQVGIHTLLTPLKRTTIPP